MIDKSSLLRSQGSLYLEFIPKDGLFPKMLLLSLMGFLTGWCNLKLSMEINDDFRKLPIYRCCEKRIAVRIVFSQNRNIPIYRLYRPPLQERQQFEAWRASQAQPQLQAPISSSGPLRLGTMLRLIQVGQPVLKGLDLKTRSLTKLKLNVQGLLQHLADPPLPRGNTLWGLAQPLGHLRPVPNWLSIHLLLLRTLKPLNLTDFDAVRHASSFPK